MGSHEPIRWTIGRASDEFGPSRQALTARIKQAGVTMGDDGLYSTRDIAAAIFGDLEAEKTRLTKAQADVTELKKRQLLLELVPVAVVEKVVGAIMQAFRQKVMALPEISDRRKKEFLTDLQNVPIDDYFAAAREQSQSGSDQDAEAA